jgi:hypothetical protein
MATEVNEAQVRTILGAYDKALAGAESLRNNFEVEKGYPKPMADALVAAQTYLGMTLYLEALAAEALNAAMPQPLAASTLQSLQRALSKTRVAALHSHAQKN